MDILKNAKTERGRTIGTIGTIGGCGLGLLEGLRLDTANVDYGEARAETGQSLEEPGGTGVLGWAPGI